MNENDMRSLVEAARVGRLATVDLDRQPHLVPVCFVLLGDSAYSAVDHKRKRHARLRRIANIEATGRVSLLVDEYSEDWTALWWVRLDGSGRVVEEPGEAALAIGALVDKYEQYGELAPSGPVIAVDITRWSGWSAA